MAGGVPLSSYLDWVANTGPQFLSGTDNIINNVSKQSYLLSKFLRGKPASQILQGSNKIQETLFLNANSTFKLFERNEDVVWQNPQKDVVMSLDWKFIVDHMAWDEAEYLLQTSGLSGAGLATKYKDMAASKQQRLWQSMVDGLEDEVLWATPSGEYASMEGGGKGWYSIPVFINEDTNQAGFDSDWLNIEGVTAADYGGDGGNWDNKRASYSETDGVPTTEEDLFAAFDEVMVDINYKPPGMKDDYFESETSPGNDLCIATSHWGFRTIMTAHRGSNESLITPQDSAYPMPRYNGAAITPVTALNTASLYPGGPEATATAVGPRFYFMNTKYLNMVFHNAKYFDIHKPRPLENKIGVLVQPVELWGNLTCTSRRHQGLVHPVAAA